MVGLVPTQLDRIPQRPTRVWAQVKWLFGAPSAVRQTVWLFWQDLERKVGDGLGLGNVGCRRRDLGEDEGRGFWMVSCLWEKNGLGKKKKEKQ